MLPLFPSVKGPGRNKCYLTGTQLEYDFSWKSLKIAVEIQGGIDSSNRRSGHLSRSGIRRDMRKVCLSSLHGWMLFQFAPEQIKDDRVWRTYTLPILIEAFSIRCGTV